MLVKAPGCQVNFFHVVHNRFPDNGNHFFLNICSDVLVVGTFCRNSWELNSEIPCVVSARDLCISFCWVTFNLNNTRDLKIYTVVES